jgi:cell division protein FtsL
LVITNYRLSNTRAELAVVKETSRILELEAAQLGTIGRIEQIAKVDLGMVEPEIGQLRILTAHQGEGNRLGE